MRGFTRRRGCGRLGVSRRANHKNAIAAFTAAMAANRLRLVINVGCRMRSIRGNQFAKNADQKRVGSLSLLMRM
jgi:hypothetical protein